MLVVVSKNWDSVDGTLQRFEYASPTWQPVGQPIQIVLGRAGLAWGRGLHPTPEPGPQKHEGDGKSPAGVFTLPSAFGYAAQEKLPGIKIPYVQCTGSLECVDDPRSKHYNEILDRPATGADWNSSEKMLLKNDQYRLGIFVNHNASPAEPGCGSCVFMHIWEGPGIGTSGCTAMRGGDMELVLGWIDARANPVLVQLPESEYHRLQQAWHLPEISTNSVVPSAK